MILGHFRLFQILLFLLIVVVACSNEETTPPATVEDSTPPGVVTDLTVGEVSESSALLRWTAPAEDDSGGGRVTVYDLRFRLDSLDGGVWGIAEQAENEPDPSDPGFEETYILEQLEEGTEYACGIRSLDDAGLVSGLSNIALFRTEPGESVTDTIPPATVVDLSVLDIGTLEVTLRWTAVGDDGNEGEASAYDLRYRVGEIDEEAWNLSTVAAGLPDPGPPGTEETVTVPGLHPETTYGFGLVVVDEESNRSGLSNLLQVITNPRSPDFIDPRGIDVHPVIGDVYVADHGDSAIYVFGMLSRPRRMVAIPGVLGVLRTESSLFYAISGSDRSGSGALWSFAGTGADPVLRGSGFGIPSDIGVDRLGNVLVSTKEPGAVLRFGTLGGDPEVLVSEPDAEITGVASDREGNVYFGVRREGLRVIRKRTPEGSLSDLHVPKDVEDLIEDPDHLGIWYLDPGSGAVVRVAYDGSSLDSLATGLIDPVAMAPASPIGEPAFYYASRNGFVQLVTRRSGTKEGRLRD